MWYLILLTLELCAFHQPGIFSKLSQHYVWVNVLVVKYISAIVYPSEIAQVLLSPATPLHPLNIHTALTTPQLPLQSPHPQIHTPP